MPTPQDFMERVVAWPGPDEPGYVNLHWRPPGEQKMMPGRPFRNIQDFMNFAQWGTLKPSVMQEIYFCLSTQSMLGKQFKDHHGAARGIHFALNLKALWLDVDVKPEKGYASLSDAVDAIARFTAAAGLPPPSALVLSGGGIHVYWISDRPLTVAEWRPYAEGLKAEAIRLGLKCDAGLTTDAARVLRVPGTYNRKTTPPRPVRLAHLGASYEFAKDLARLPTVAPIVATVTGPVTKALVPFDLSAFTGKKPHPLLAHLDPQTDKLSAGINLHDDRPLDWAGVLAECPHYRETFKTHGAGQSQGLWMLTVLGTTFMEDGRALARTLSKGHSTYDRDATDAMYDRKVNDREDRGLGWPGCSAFASEGCKQCALCPYNGKIKSPLNLAMRVPAAPAPSPYAAPAPADLFLPPGYTVDPATGIIGAIVKQKSASGEAEDGFAPLFHCKIMAPETTAGAEGASGALNFRISLDKGRTGPVSIKDSQMATEQMLVIALCEQRCKPVAANQRYLVSFMRAWTQQMDDARQRLKTEPYGWIWADGDNARERSGFAYGGKVWHKDGTATPAGHADPLITSAYMPVGKIQPYYDVMEAISELKNPALEVLAATGYAGPLMCIGGEDNTTLWGWSPAAGAFKSTAIRAGMAMWGDPRKAKITPQTSILSIQHTMGTLRSIPVYGDEVGRIEQVEMIGQHINTLSEGTTDGKQTRSGHARERKEWQTMLTIGANHSVRDYLVKKNKSSDAQLVRVFEFQVQKQAPVRHPPDVRRMVEALDNNYGWMGLQYAEHIGKNFPAILDAGKSIERDFMAEVNATEAQRFWTSACVAVITGAIQANAITKATIQKEFFHIDLIWKFLVDTFKEQQEYIKRNITVGGTALSAEDTLTAFIGAHQRNQLWTANLPGRFKPGFVDVIKSFTNPPMPVFMHWYRDDRILRISKAAFVKFIEEREGETVEPVMAGLAKHLGAIFPKPRLNLVAGVPNLSGGPERIIEIMIPPGSPFEDAMMAYTAMDDRTATGVAATEIAAPAEPDLLAAGIAQAAADLAVVKAG